MSSISKTQIAVAHCTYTYTWLRFVYKCSDSTYKYKWTWGVKLPTLLPCHQPGWWEVLFLAILQSTTLKKLIQEFDDIIREENIRLYIIMTASKM